MHLKLKIHPWVSDATPGPHPEHVELHITVEHEGQTYGRVQLVRQEIFESMLDVHMEQARREIVKAMTEQKEQQ